MILWVVSVGASRPPMPWRAMRLTKVTGPLGVRSTNFCSVTCHPITRKESTIYFLAFTSASDPEGRGPNATRRSTCANAFGPENSFQSSAGAARVGAAAGAGATETGAGGAAPVTGLGLWPQAPKRSVAARRTRLLRFIVSQPKQIQNPLEIVHAVIFHLDLAALFPVPHDDVRGKVLLKPVLQMLEGRRDAR